MEHKVQGVGEFSLVLHMISFYVSTEEKSPSIDALCTPFAFIHRSGGLRMRRQWEERAHVPVQGHGNLALCTVAQMPHVQVRNGFLTLEHPDTVHLVLTGADRPGAPRSSRPCSDCHRDEAPVQTLVTSARLPGGGDCTCAPPR